ncbi:hypothetical protein OQ968_16365 [Mycobacterium sp. 663a-19]|uniref:hypothetical protein n=1 Tax=Mycobacterium sp. 663a-19 TaxID=2986148 RepID=UPI002D1F988A|nr:hypothetical protein [Mycobacterium sp. 663a-19]MEB3982835.1 hypothetical protein [Mycobacterium sp. 663a-19]
MIGYTCAGCGVKARWSYGGWPDRRRWAAAAVATMARIAGLSERHPTAALALVVPGTLIVFAAVATYPLVFVPLVLLACAALVAAVHHEETRNEESGRDPACPRTDCPDTRRRTQSARG